MAERKQCEFFLVRYVPDTVKDEFVNIGVLLREAAPTQSTSQTAWKERETQVRFTRDWARVRCVDPEADIAMLEALEVEVRGKLNSEDLHVVPQMSVGGPQYLSMMNVLEDSFSNVVQITGAKGCLAESIPAELEQLMRLYVEPRQGMRRAHKGGRAAILTKMRSQFDRVGVWDLMRKRIPAASYTQPGDPLRIDCGYRPNGLVRMFHAVSLDGDLEMAKVLAFSASAMRLGIRRAENADFELTAIIEPLTDIRREEEETERLTQYQFAVEIMEQHTIRVLTTRDLLRVAETASRELKV